jgi:predicted DNA-binding transcriptional regulator AlpA
MVLPGEMGMIFKIDIPETTIKALAEMIAIEVKAMIMEATSIPTPTPLIAPDPTRYVNEMEAAAILGYAVQTLRNWRGRSAGPPYVKRGRSIRYRREDLVAWMEKAKVVQRNLG